MACKGCGGDRTDIVKGVPVCHFCGKELENTPIRGMIRIHGSTGSNRAMSIEDVYGNPTYIYSMSTLSTI